MELSNALRVRLAALLSLMILAGLTGCAMPAKVISSADPPDVVFADFISALKNRDFEKANQYLADGASVIPENQDGDALFDCFIELSLRKLSSEPLEKVRIDGMEAYIGKVKVETLNKNGFIPWVKNELPRLEHDYMLKNNLTEFDSRDRKAVSEMLSTAMYEYARNAPVKSSFIRVSFVYCDNQWKIDANDDLIESIFGGV